MPSSLFDRRFNLGEGDTVKVTKTNALGEKIEHLHYDHTGATTTVRIRVDLDDEPTEEGND